MRLLKLLVLSIFTVFFIPSLAWATVILDDDYNNFNYVDSGKTTAKVDTTSGWVTLPQVNKPNSIAMRQFGYEYAVATAAGVKMFSYDDATGTMKENTALSIPSVTSALGIAVRQDAPNIWALTNSELTLYKFNGTSISTNPNLVVAGLTDIVSVSSWSTEDKAAVLSRSGIVQVYNANSGTVIPELSFDTGKTNPIAVSVVSGSPDLIVATQDAYYYYAYDDAIGGYVEDPRRTVLGLSGIVSVSSNNSGSVVLTTNAAKYYLNNDAGTPQQAVALSTGPLSSAAAISVKPESYDYAVITDTGDVQYYMYDDASGSVTRVSSLEVTGLALAGGYMHPREYYSKVVTTGQSYDEIKLTVNDDIPVGTSISYYITSDGGVTWNAVTTGDWVPVNSGNRFAVKAVLDTSDENVTPKILHVTLEVTTLNIKNLKVLAIAFNDPTQSLPTSILPVKVKAGAEILMEVTTEGFAENVYADFSTGANIVFTATNNITNEVNTWRGLYTVPVDAVEGSPITTTITAERNTKQKHLTVSPFIVVNGKVSDVVDLKMTK
ncbi:hypothetical protein [Desulfotruncus alcoholivorax]|uniref:hypothetical protein n=1 Tax=Desulfotruncus alcoholivorax TaxID=265477 RepID=UPI000425649A|nr:hypothetical protein [Desulfotruncus alcoholivorax]